MSRLFAAQELSVLKNLRVYYERELVGTLALTKDDRTAFEYSDNWLVDGFSLSPLSLPLEKRVFLPKAEPFEGVFGIFNESLPDGWGWLLVDRMLRRRGVEPTSLHRLARLAIVGSLGEVQKLFRLMCFNVLAQNLDDHAKNFAFLFDRTQSQWSLSPAFDLTWSTGMMGEHATTVMGKGKDISKNDLVDCGVSMGLSRKNCTKASNEVQEIAAPLAKKWQS